LFHFGGCCDGAILRDGDEWNFCGQDAVAIEGAGLAEGFRGAGSAVGMTTGEVGGAGLIYYSVGVDKFESSIDVASVASFVFDVAGEKVLWG